MFDSCATTFGPDSLPYRWHEESARTDIDFSNARLRAYYKRPRPYSASTEPPTKKGGLYIADPHRDYAQGASQCTSFRSGVFLTSPNSLLFCGALPQAGSTSSQSNVVLVADYNTTSYVYTCANNYFHSQLFDPRASTALGDYWNAETTRAFERLFGDANEMQFEDGIESGFSSGLVSLVKRHGGKGVRAIGELINDHATNDEVAWEALRWLGRMKDAPTYYDRLSLLERTLNSPRARLRDAAALSLASMDDPSALHSLQQAVEREDNPDLRHDMEVILRQLQRA